MPIVIAPEDTRPDVDLKVKVDPDFMAEIEDYAQYLDSKRPAGQKGARTSVAHVVKACVTAVFQNDSGFKAWRKEKPKSATGPNEGEKDAAAGKPKSGRKAKPDNEITILSGAA